MTRRALTKEQRARQNTTWRRWYEKNRKRKISWHARRRRDIRVWLNSYKADRACAQCGEGDPVCLAFHHRDPASKELDVSLAGHGGWSRARLENEISKCDVLCANCHAKLHWNEKHGA